MVSDSPDPTTADDDAPGDTLPPAEALDPDDVRNDDGDEVVDPPDEWHEADKFGLTASEMREGEPLDDKLAAEEPDFGARPPTVPEGAPDFPPPDIERDVGDHRGQIDDTPEDGDSLFPVVE